MIEVSIFLYLAETWPLILRNDHKIDAMNMWCWRRLLKIPWMAFHTNASIVKELCIKDRLSSTVQRLVLKFFDHISRKEDSMERLVVQGRVEDKRSCGWSPIHWTVLIKKITESTLVQCTRNALNCQIWKAGGVRHCQEGNPREQGWSNKYFQETRVSD